MKNNRITLALLATVVFMAALTVILYVYPFGGALYSVRSNNNSTAGNSIATAAFLNANGFQNGTNLASFYQVQNSTNEIILGCDFGIQPKYMNIPLLQQLENSTDYAEYISFVSGVGLLTACESNESLPGCSDIKQYLYNLSSNVINITAVETLFIQTKTLLSYAYTAVENSTLKNSSFFYPVFNDTAIMNATTINNSATNFTTINKSAMLESMINLLPIPQYVLDYSNGSSIADPFYLDVPFRFHSLVFPFKQACNDNVFNLVSNVTTFGSAVYTPLYSDLGRNITNICINSSQNRCTTAVMKEFNFSFYEQA